MGFPGSYTDIPGATDAKRYKALGNSMAIPVMRWLGERIGLVDRISLGVEQDAGYAEIARLRCGAALRGEYDKLAE